eukprot:6017189-Amphidinium_carterae.1
MALTRSTVVYVTKEAVSTQEHSSSSFASKLVSNYCLFRCPTGRNEMFLESNSKRKDSSD